MEEPNTCSVKAERGLEYPPPLVVSPAAQHKHTIILLHGRGSNADDFGPALLEHPLPDGSTLRETLPNAKFVFLTASWRRATLYGRKLTRQWFDNWKLETPRARQELQVDGLRETSGYLHKLLNDEIKEIGDAKNVVLGGLSQGCAATLTALMLWEGPPFAAAVGMCGWLPFRYELERGGIENEDGNDDGSISFGDEDADADDRSLAAKAVGFLRDMLDMPPTPGETVDHGEPGFLRIPLFLGHGTEDDRVYLHLGREAAGCFRALGAEVTWREYPGLGHWYSGPMLAELVGLVKKALEVL